MTRHLLVAGAALAALSLAACGPKSETKSAKPPAEQAPTPAAPAATVATPANAAAAPDFVAKAGASDMFEVAAAKLAQTKSKNPEVKKFAAEMISAHTKSTEALKKAITDSGQTTLAPPAALPPDLQGKLDDLGKAESFDKAYMDNQVDAHQGALDVMQHYAQDGDVPAIKAFAAATAPVVQQHLDLARKIRDGLK